MLVADIQEEYNQKGCEATDGEVDIDLRLLSVHATLGSGIHVQQKRQDTRLANTPPRTGPIPPAKAHIPSVSPIKRLRCLRLNRSLIQTWTSKISPPPAAPWNARPMIKASIVFAVAHIAELAKNTASAATKMGLRPQISESLAHMGPDAALANRNAPPIQV
jgi:hypothetical protein